jgi:hypothetical protein
MEGWNQLLEWGIKLGYPPLLLSFVAESTFYGSLYLGSELGTLARHLGQLFPFSPPAFCRSAAGQPFDTPRRPFGAKPTFGAE